MIPDPLPPPAGYDSWLDYAVEQFDTRQPGSKDISIAASMNL